MANNEIKEVKKNENEEVKVTLKERISAFGEKHPKIVGAAKTTGKVVGGAALFGLGILVGGKLNSEPSSPEDDNFEGFEESYDDSSVEE